MQYSDVDWQLHYCSRNPESCAFRDELVQHPQAEKVHFHHSSTGTRLELARLLADIEPGTHVYTCGPEALNEEVRSEAARLDIAADTMHFEQFAIEDKTGDAFTTVLARSGKEFVVPEEMTILQVIENNKAAKVECLCREGVCGTCETAILEGEADHRDQYFSDEERASQQSMLICCSRAKGKRPVLICLPKPDVALSAPSPASEDFTADIPAINCVMLPPSAHHASRKSAPANCSAVSVSSASSAVG